MRDFLNAYSNCPTMLEQRIKSIQKIKDQLEEQLYNLFHINDDDIIDMKMEEHRGREKEQNRLKERKDSIEYDMIASQM